MTLRRRLLVAVGGLAAVLLVAGVSVVLVQRAFLVDRLDAQLAALATNPRAILLASQRASTAGSTGATAAGLSDVWVGRMSGEGRLTTVLAPDTDPDLVPALARGEVIPTPEGRPTASGEARRVRVVTATLPNGRAQAVLAVPTTSADVATRRLALTLGLVGLVAGAAVFLLLWWVDRLGLRPIAQMTEAADAITAGDTTRRVPPGPPGTEAATLGEALNAMIDSTAATQERMRRFVADASHELRTPLTTLQGYAALHAGRAAAGQVGQGGRAGNGARVEDRGERPDADDAMRRIGDEAARMRRLVDGLLDLARLDDLGIIRRDPVDVGVLVRDVASDLRVVAPDRVVTVEAPDSVVVPGDRDRITQALVGLTSNAVRHTPAGTPVWIRVVEQPHSVRVDVADAGPGIPAEHVPHVFERFHRVDRGRSSTSGGTGLGLAIVEAIARAHAGDASVVSEVGRGSTFSVTLPT